MAKRRLFLAGLFTGLLSACGVSRKPATKASGSGGGTPVPSPAPSSPKPSQVRPTLPAVTEAGPGGSRRMTGTDAVSLTFDDGPDTTYTPQILDLLKQYDVRATFSVIGSRARDYPDLIRRIVDEGHNLCCHSWQHLMDLGQRPWSYQNWDLRSTVTAIQTAVPDGQVFYFRAPGGGFTDGLVQLAESLGMYSLYWDVDPRDWDSDTYGHGQSMVDHIVSVVKSTTRPGSIILSHDRVRPDTVAAYKILLPWLTSTFKVNRLP
jgi:peptidoglycan/xylan/chitin deacetylase (PgdA/CDA1 family)